MGWILYLFTLAATFLILGFAPVMLLSSAIHRDRRTLLAISAVLVGFLTGGLAAWLFRPAGWPLPLWETAVAAGNAEKYGHPLEHAAEQLLLFMLFAGDVVAIAAGALVFRKVRPRSFA